ncbi:MAG: DNA-directed RNA polymerase subunit beta', partial [Patescibacteria group bacterium]
IEGHAIQIHPLVCTAFNADFDGDQMAVHLPLTEEAQKEARTLMVATKNLLKPANGKPIVMPTKDMVLGCYWVTTYEDGTKGDGKLFSSEEEALLASEFDEIDLKSKIKVRMVAHHHLQEGAKGEKAPIIETSAGRILFNRILPEGFDFVNEDMKSKNLEALILRLIKRYGDENIPPILDKIKKFGFEYATRSGVSWGINDLHTPTEKKNIIKKAQDEVNLITAQYQNGLLTDWERYNRIVEIWLEAKELVLGELKKSMPRYGSVFTMIDSGARGGWVQTNQMAGMKGPVVNPSGRTIELPIISSYKEGLNVLEYFISTHGARKGTADTALKTAAAGYLTRRLVDVAQDVILSEEDCGTKRGIFIFRSDSDEIGKTIASRIFSRYAAADIKDPSTGKTIIKTNELIDDDIAHKIEDAGVEKVPVRSPISCSGIRGICQKCYGWDLSNNRPIKLGEVVGVISAQAIGEPGTQLTMRTFHIGGVAGSGDITSGLPRVEEVFEARKPKGEALLSDVDGVVEDILELNKEKIIRIRVQNVIREKKLKTIKDKKTKLEAKEGEIKEFHVLRGVGLTVEKGSQVFRGGFLSEGHADIATLYKLTSSADVQRYLVKEIQKIYSGQGAPIHDKHIEVIIRQMFARVKVKDVGDSPFTAGEIMSKTRFREENNALMKEGKQKATAYQLIYGITKSALSTDSVFSAASFIETARVLINAAIEGKKDYLRGLKENVIIGHLIPAGTGYRPKIKST